MSNATLESLLIKQAQIEARIKDIHQKEKAQERKKMNRAKYIMGSVILAEAKNNPANARKMIRFLSSKITNKKDHQFFHDWIVDQEYFKEAE